MAPRLYISDVDHTLIRSDKTLSQYSRNIINKMHETDVKFTIASARSIFSLDSILKGVSFSLPIIEFNGAYLTDFKTKEHLQIIDLPLERVTSILEVGLQYNIQPFISSTYKGRDHLTCPETTNQGMYWYLKNRLEIQDPRIRYSADYLEEESIVSLTFIGDFTLLNEIKKNLEQSKIINELSFAFYENQYSPGWWWLSINHLKANKFDRIQELRKLYDLLDYELTVFGDNYNDLPMMMGADRAIAVENALPEVKNESDVIIGHHNTDSVARFIETELITEGFW
ncbi:MAG: HAD hydrolase family protein [Candidatus Heimdallarchaeota archaeon]|nr:HAD hydrolase family protein [Candidatus Heimdallarchaeota archaeon]